MYVFLHLVVRFYKFRKFELYAPSLSKLKSPDASWKWS